GVVIALAIAVGVDNEGCPTDSFLRVVCFIPHFCVDPACYRAGAGQPQSIVGVIAELRMMRAEASVDEVILHRLWIEHCDLTGTLIDRENLGVWVTGTLLAPVRVVHPAHGRRQPDPALLVEHWVVVVSARVPKNLASPIRRICRRRECAGMARP